MVQLYGRLKCSGCCDMCIEDHGSFQFGDMVGTTQYSWHPCRAGAPLHRETGKFHLWRPDLILSKCVSLVPLRPRQLLISPLHACLFIMFESVTKRGGMRETCRRIKGCVGGSGEGWMGVRGLTRVHHSGLSERDGFIIPGNSMWLQMWWDFSVSAQTLLLILHHLVLSVSSLRCRLFRQILGQFGWNESMDQSLLSSHIYEVKPWRLMRWMWLSSNAAGEAQWCRSASATLESWSSDFIYYYAIIKNSQFSAWFSVSTGRVAKGKWML